MTERDDLIRHLGDRSPSQLADDFIALEDRHEAVLADVNADVDALWDKVGEQGDRILAAQLIHTPSYSGGCGAKPCKKNHPGPCETSIALGVTE
jgi:hypothetical protein